MAVVSARRGTTESPSWKCFPGAEPRQIPIDPNGNLTSKTEGSDVWAYEWNAENQLTRVTKNTIEQARFSYDPRGRRVEKVAGGVTTNYTYNGLSIVREIREATTLKYVHGEGVDEPLAVDDGTSLSYFHADGLGSIVKVTNAAGSVTLSRQYDAWGNLEVGAGEGGYAFTGREWDIETGLYYYRARYADLRIGRFLNEDPIGFRGGANFYAYALGSPVRFTDPLGLTVADNWNIFWDWVWDTGQTTRYYDQSDSRTQDMARTNAMGRILDDYKAKGCPKGCTVFSQPSLQAYADTLGSPGNQTQFQVGGFTGTICNQGGGTVTIHLFNQLSTRSFFGESALQQVWRHRWILPPNPRGGAFPWMGQMDQHFVWTVPDPCACSGR